MRFDQFSVKKGASEGRLWHLKHLRTRAFLFEKVTGEDGVERSEPVGVVLRSMESSEVSEAILGRQRRLAEGRPSEDEQYIIARALVVRFQHIHHEDGRLLESTPEDIDWFFGLSREFVTGAVQFSNDAGNFIGAE